MEGRIWQRGASKDRKSSVNRMQKQQQNQDDDFTSGLSGDSIMSAAQRSLIAQTIKGAKASLHEPSRPFTPGDMPRHLFYGDDYTNRPGSSYKMNNVMTQAVDEFNSAIKTGGMGSSFQGSMSSTTMDSSAQKQRAMDSQNQVIDMLKRSDTFTKGKGAPLPKIDSKAVRPVIKMKKFDRNQPIKPVVVKMQEEETKTIVNKQPAHKKDQTDLSDLKNKEDTKARFDESMQGNMAKMMEITKMLQSTNVKGRDDTYDDDEEDLEDAMERELLAEADQMGIFQNAVQSADMVDYEAALKNVQQQVEKSQQEGTNVKTKQNVDNEDDLAMDQLLKEEESAYCTEYKEVINNMGMICRQIQHNSNPKNKDKLVKIDENQIKDLCPRIWVLSADHNKQPVEDRQKCFLETLLKGSFSMLAIKTPEVSLKISACNINIFFKIFDSIINKESDIDENDFKKIFNSLFETIRGLLIFAKEGKYDIMFKEENLIPQLCMVISRLYIENSDVLIKLTSQVVAGKEILNDDRLYDFINYTIGTIKCFTQQNKEVQQESVDCQMIDLLSETIEKTQKFGSNTNKKSMILVQITGTLRNLANIDSAHYLIAAADIVEQLISILLDKQYVGGKELILNISRLLSKTSLDIACAEQMAKSGNIGQFLQLMDLHKESSAVLIRLAFILGNLTTNFEEARQQLVNVPNCFSKVMDLVLFYLGKDESGAQHTKEISKDAKAKKYEEFSAGNIEDALTKLIKLMANLATEEDVTKQTLCTAKPKLLQFFSKLVGAINRRTIAANEEFILNAISCITNLLYYDLPQNELLNADIRIEIFKSIKLFILATKNEEIQIEAVRVLSNLSRHAHLCQAFVTEQDFLEALTIVLDNTLRELVFYSVGIIINISLYEVSRPKILEKGIINKLIDVLKDANMEDMELAKVAAKALHNIEKDVQFWTDESVAKLDEIITQLAEELDEILDVATEDEAAEIGQLRSLLNQLINDMPEIMRMCPEPKCGRKFKTDDELNNHISRRHQK